LIKIADFLLLNAKYCKIIMKILKKLLQKVKKYYTIIVVYFCHAFVRMDKMREDLKE